MLVDLVALPTTGSLQSPFNPDPSPLPTMPLSSSSQVYSGIHSSAMTPPYSDEPALQPQIHSAGQSPARLPTSTSDTSLTNNNATASGSRAHRIRPQLNPRHSTKSSQSLMPPPAQHFASPVHDMPIPYANGHSGTTALGFTYHQPGSGSASSSIPYHSSPLSGPTQLPPQAYSQPYRPYSDINSYSTQPQSVPSNPYFPQSSQPMGSSLSAQSYLSGASSNSPRWTPASEEGEMYFDLGTAGEDGVEGDLDMSFALDFETGEATGLGMMTDDDNGGIPTNGPGGRYTYPQPRSVDNPTSTSNSNPNADCVPSSHLFPTTPPSSLSQFPGTPITPAAPLSASADSPSTSRSPKKSLSGSGAASAPGSGSKTKHTPRPPNAWILYRSDMLKAIAAGETLPGLSEVMAEAGLSSGTAGSSNEESGAEGPSTRTSGRRGSGSGNGNGSGNKSAAEDQTSTATAAAEGSKSPTKNPKTAAAAVPFKQAKGKKGAKDPTEGMLSLGRGKTGRGLPQADISKMISMLWKRESAEVRGKYEQLSTQRKNEHNRLYPDYKFQPLRKADKDKQRAERRMEKDVLKRQKEAAKIAGRAANKRTPKVRPLPTSPYAYNGRPSVSRSLSYSGGPSHTDLPSSEREPMPSAQHRYAEWRNSRAPTPAQIPPEHFFRAQPFPFGAAAAPALQPYLTGEGSFDGTQQGYDSTAYNTSNSNLHSAAESSDPSSSYLQTPSYFSPSGPVPASHGQGQVYNEAETGSSAGPSRVVSFSNIPQQSGMHSHGQNAAATTAADPPPHVLPVEHAPDLTYLDPALAQPSHQQAPQMAQAPHQQVYNPDQQQHQQQQQQTGQYLMEQTVPLYHSIPQPAWFDISGLGPAYGEPLIFEPIPIPDGQALDHVEMVPDPLDADGLAALWCEIAAPSPSDEYNHGYTGIRGDAGMGTEGGNGMPGVVNWSYDAQGAMDSWATLGDGSDLVFENLDLSHAVASQLQTDYYPQDIPHALSFSYPPEYYQNQMQAQAQAQAQIPVNGGIPAPASDPASALQYTTAGIQYSDPTIDSNAGYINIQCMDPSNPNLPPQPGYAAAHAQNGYNPNLTIDAAGSTQGPFLSTNQPLSPGGWSAGIPTPRELTFRRSILSSNVATPYSSTDPDSSTAQLQRLTRHHDESQAGFDMNPGTRQQTSAEGGTAQTTLGARYVSNSAYPSVSLSSEPSHGLGWGDRSASFAAAAAAMMDPAGFDCSMGMGYNGGHEDWSGSGESSPAVDAAAGSASAPGSACGSVSTVSNHRMRVVSAISPPIPSSTSDSAIVPSQPYSNLSEPNPSYSQHQSQSRQTSSSSNPTYSQPRQYPSESLDPNEIERPTSVTPTKATFSGKPSNTRSASTSVSTNTNSTSATGSGNSNSNDTDKSSGPGPRKSPFGTTSSPFSTGLLPSSSRIMNQHGLGPIAAPAAVPPGVRGEGPPKGVRRGRVVARQF